MCEQTLLAAAKRGQEEAFGALCQPLARKLIQTTQRITRNREDAEDALQDAFLSAFTHIKNFDARSSFSTWLTRIAINAALMTLRKKRSLRQIPIGSSELGANGLGWEVPDPSPNPEKVCAQREKGRLLREAIRELRPTIRQVVEIQQLQEISVKEAAKMMGISVTAVKGRLFHARRALRRACSLRTNQHGRTDSKSRFFRTGTVVEPQLNRRPGQSPCNIGRTSQVPGTCHWLHCCVDLGEKQRLAQVAYMSHAKETAKLIEEAATSTISSQQSFSQRRIK